MVAVLTGALLVTSSGPVGTAQVPGSPPAAPYRVGYAGNDTTTLMAAGPGGPGAVAALPDTVPGIADFDASAGGSAALGTAGLVWVSKRAASPGGVERDGELWYLQYGATAARRLTDDDAVEEHPALSPDGQWVAFGSDRAGNPDIWIIRTDGSGARRVTDSPAADDWPTWSPDGSRIAFSSTRDDPAGEIYTVPAAGGTPARITADPGADTQPAWSPLDDRIAFTTTRFHPAGDLVLGTAGGGPVTRVVPDPVDSGEAAWSPDGAEVAFTTRHVDPQGDVYAVAPAGVITPVSANPNEGETHPTWRRGGDRPPPDLPEPKNWTGHEGGHGHDPGTADVIFTRLYRGDTSDIWSADQRGLDRRDHTARPGADERDPAYSPDGTRLAYTEYTDAGSRVIVADAEGRGATPLTGLAPSERERDPAWSPDGSMIALTHAVPLGEGYRSSVRIVRVADGLALGEVQVPAPLAGEDVQPAWSPDGSRIALVRTASRTAEPPPNVTPASVDQPAAPGTSFTVGKVVRTPVVPADPDIVLLIDGTGSMENVIDGVRAELLKIVEQVRARQASARFGVAVYRDTGDGPDRAFGVELQPSAVDSTELGRALGRIRAAGGGDIPEDWLNALYQVSTGAIGFLPTSSKVVVLVGDASSHDPSNGFTLADATRELAGHGIRVVGVPVGQASDGLDGAGQATAVAAATRGVVVPPTTEPAQVADAIVTGLTSLKVTVTPVVSQCDPGLSVRFDPAGPTEVPGGDDAGYTETTAVDATAPVGATLRCTVEFRLNGESTVRPGYTERIAVRVTGPRQPTVIVDDATVEATGPDGAAIQYSVRATDAGGAPLPARCSPPPGATFPVGTTTVTCTATDAAGNTASDTATMTVLGGTGESGPVVQRIWLVGVGRPDPDHVTVTDQIDLSARIGEPCAGAADTAPSWSPDGRSLAFEHGRGICVAGADGSNVRWVVQGDERSGALLDPAWSPDGTFIAFADDPVDGTSPRIWTVPLAGGQPGTLIQSPGGAEQPAFRRVPDLLVTGAVTPPSIGLGGRTAVEFTVTNHGTGAAPGTELTASLPPGLRGEDMQASRGTCEPAGLRCALGPVAAGESVLVRIVVTGVVPGSHVARAAVRTLLPEATAGGNEATATVEVTQAPAQPAGSLSVTTAVSPGPVYVGGDDLVVSYTVRNAAPVPMPAVTLSTTLPASLRPPTAVSPAACRADGTGCDLGELAPGQVVEVRFTFRALAATDSAAAATVTTTGPDPDPADNTATARVVVLGLPVLAVDPAIGPQGFVTRAVGAGFPPGASIRLIWSVGISETPGIVEVRPDGTIEAQALVFHHDELGYRQLLAVPVSGPRFGDVLAQPFLVLPRAVQPPPFVTRG
jgi:Tol biopolymer transport system component